MAIDEESVEKELVFLGFAGIIDPPRPEVAGAIRMAKSAGIKIFMITGDSPDTALAIAKSVSLECDRAITSLELSQKNDEELKALLGTKVLFARVEPEDKLRIVKILQQMDEVVGMTGDGVNDAPALKQADIGISMGIRGTDVAKSASDMILTDDNFASIIKAIKEGRRQYDNIKKFVRYLLSSNTGEIIAIFVNILLGGPLILLPVQILWMNLVTDGVTAAALGTEPAEQGLMKRPPRSVDEPILDKNGVIIIALLGSYIAAVTVLLFHYYLPQNQESGMALAQTVAFTGIIILEKANVLNFRSFSAPITNARFFSNRWILLAILVTVGLQACAVYVPILQKTLHTVALSWKDWGIIVLASAPIFIVTEGIKRWRYR